MQNKPPKPKKCHTCRELFTPQRFGQVDCSPKCAIDHLKADKAKKARKEHREAKVKLRSRRDWLALAQKSFNAFVRARDAHMPCICCGLPLSVGSIGGGFDCGHYRSVGSAPHLRFDLRNAHGQRKQCNRWGSGRAVDYRLGLIQRIGVEAVEELEADQTSRKYTIPDLQELCVLYKAKLKQLT